MALGIFICKPPRSVGKVKRAVDVFGDICQASLLHVTKASVSFLNSFSGQIITGPEKLPSALFRYTSDGFPRILALKAGWVQMEMCWEMAISFLFVTDQHCLCINARFMRQASCPLVL